MNIQQQTTSEVDNTDIVMDDNIEIYPPSPQDISNVFAAADLLSCSSSDLFLPNYTLPSDYIVD